MYAAHLTENHPELARQAIITAFLYKNRASWEDDDQSLDQLAQGRRRRRRRGNYDEDDVGDDFAQMFDQEGGRRE